MIYTIYINTIYYIQYILYIILYTIYHPHRPSYPESPLSRNAEAALVIPTLWLQLPLPRGVPYRHPTGFPTVDDMIKFGMTLYTQFLGVVDSIVYIRSRRISIVSNIGPCFVGVCPFAC